ncbi:MAG: hypothetical protein IK086_06545 [Clostridia bacterium]|nr:hypothetical protein [Clostridia bacterium]
MALRRIIPFILILSSAVFTAFIGRYGIAAGGIDLSPAEYVGIIKLWHIDTFEGGVGSRKQFLLSVAAAYEKAHKGTLIMVVSHTADSAKTAMEEGVFPDMISYGAGVTLPELSELPAASSFGGGRVGEKTYAAPWCRGGYVLIENPAYKESKKRKDPEAVFSVGRFNDSLTAGALCGKVFNGIAEKAPLAAYVEFVSGRCRFLFGTQRDIHRLKGRGMDHAATVIEEYNDLYQYISVCAKENKLAAARGFAEFLLSEKVQKKLSDIGMFSCFYDVEYDDITLKALQNAKFEYTVSAFSSEEFIESLKGLSANFYGGDGGAFIKIKKLLTLS